VSADVSARLRQTAVGGGGRASLVVGSECGIRVSVVDAVVFAEAASQVPSWRSGLVSVVCWIGQRGSAGPPMYVFRPLEFVGQFTGSLGRL